MIPISKPSISETALRYVNDALKSGWVSSIGEYISRFEDTFAEYCDCDYAVAVSNGTVGLHLSLVALGIGANDEVIVPDLTFIATSNAVTYTNAKPVFVDVDRKTYCIDIDSVKNSITSRTKAIIPVHLYGHPANMPALLSLAAENNLFLIEDAAEAHGASIDGRKVGSFGDCGVFSFYGNKIITCGEGGIITTNDYDLAQRLRFLRDHAMSSSQRYWHTEIGYNYRMTNLQAALGLSQLEEIDNFLQIREAQLDRYRSNLNGLSIELNPTSSFQSVNWLTCGLFLGVGRESRDLLIKLMRSKGVDLRPFFHPLSTLPMYKDEEIFNPVSNFLSENGFNLPTYIGLDNCDIDYICTSLVDSINKINTI